MAPFTAPTRRAPALLLALALAACQSGGPTTSSATWLSITHPAPGQTIAGTTATAAVGVGGTPTDLTFHLHDLDIPANASGLATIDTRNLPDGPTTLRASATINGRDVIEQITITIDNDLPTNATIGTAGGALRSPTGSYATIPPGALNAPATFSLDDTTQQQILDDFGIDYPALGVTFLGALTIDATTDRLERPITLDLAGWAQAVQPNQQVVMFAVTADANSDGTGELTFAANALATPDGSVITLPTPPSQIYGPSGSATTSATRLQTITARPGQILSFTGRGYNANGPLSNVARFTGGDDDLLAIALISDDAPFNPLMEIRVAVPAVSPGSHAVTFHNLTTGNASAPVPVSVGSPVAGSAATYAALVEQVEIAIGRLAAARPDVVPAAQSWLSLVAASTSDTARSMAVASGLATSANRAALTALDPAALSAVQRGLLHDHALFLDALAASVPALAPEGADLATLIVMLTPAPLSPATLGGAVRLQSSGESCTGSTSGITFNAGSPTGMGSAGAASCAGGSTSGPGSGAGTLALGAADVLGAADARVTSHRQGSLAPVAGAFVAIYRQGTTDLLTPFTAITDASGYYHLPFVAPGEPYTIKAIHPQTATVATAEGTTSGLNEFRPVQLLFTPSASAGTLDARFTITALPRPGHYRFDNAPFNDPAQAVNFQYYWEVGSGVPHPTYQPEFVYQFLRSGVYDVELSIVDVVTFDSGTSSPQALDVQLPFDYAAALPTRLTELPVGSGTPAYAISGDGRFVAFSSNATALVPGDLNGRTDIFLYDRQTAAIERVSLDADGNEVTGNDANDPAVSGDGRYVAFTQRSVVSSNGAPRIIVKDRSTGGVQTFTPQSGLLGVRDPVLSADGRTLAFRSFSHNGGANLSQVHAVNLDTGVITWVSEGFANDRRARSPAVSANGRFVAFTVVDRDGASVITGSSTYVRDLVTGTNVRASESAAGVAANEVLSDAVLSADGRYLAFSSIATNLLPGVDGNGSERDVFVKDLVTGTVDLISANASGAQATVGGYGASISSNGRWVAFASFWSDMIPLNRSSCTLCDFDTEFVPGYAFVKDRQTGWVALLSIGVNDQMPNDYGMGPPVISGDGRYVAFRSPATNLGTGQNDGNDQLYWVENPLWEP